MQLYGPSYWLLYSQSISIADTQKIEEKNNCWKFLVKGPNIKKRESMVFDHTPLTPSPLTITMVFLLRISEICTENGQIKTTKTGLNKDSVLGDPHPRWSKTIISHFLN